MHHVGSLYILTYDARKLRQQKKVKIPTDTLNDSVDLHKIAYWIFIDMVMKEQICYIPKVNLKIKVKVKVKVKFTLEQATKAQWGSSCIALIFP